MKDIIEEMPRPALHDLLPHAFAVHDNSYFVKTLLIETYRKITIL